MRYFNTIFLSSFQNLLLFHKIETWWKSLVITYENYIKTYVVIEEKWSCFWKNNVNWIRHQRNKCHDRKRKIFSRHDWRRISRRWPRKISPINASNVCNKINSQSLVHFHINPLLSTKVAIFIIFWWFKELQSGIPEITGMVWPPSSFLSIDKGCGAVKSGFFIWQLVLTQLSGDTCFFTKSVACLKPNVRSIQWGKFFRTYCDSRSCLKMKLRIIEHFFVRRNL